MFKPLRSSGGHERGVLCPWGNGGLRWVADGNRLGSKVALMMYYSLACGCRVLLEQPNGSKACLHPRLETLLNSYPIFQTGIWGARYAQDTNCTAKRHMLYCNDGTLLHRLNVAAGYMSTSEREGLTGEPLVKRTKKDDGKTTWSGVKKHCLPASNLVATGAFCVSIEREHWVKICMKTQCSGHTMNALGGTLLPWCVRWMEMGGRLMSCGHGFKHFVSVCFALKALPCGPLLGQLTEVWKYSDLELFKAKPWNICH